MHQQQDRHKSARQPQPARSHVRNVNFSRLGLSIESDLLAAAFRLREDQVRDFIQGRVAIFGELYEHIQLGLADAGLSENWLDMPGAALPAEAIHAIKDLASLSTERAPLRRDNLKRLLKALEGQMSVLADALEVLEDGLVRILEGSIKFDDQRMNHINPRLMAAGFPNNWLELVEPEIQPEQIAGLKRLAQEGYEDPDDYPVAAPVVPPEVVSSPALPAQPIQQSPEPEANPIKETPMAATIPGSVLRAAKASTRKRNIPQTEPVVSTPEVTTVPETVKVTRVISREESLARAATLEQFLGQCRRGVKAHLWVTSLGKSASYPAVLKSGATLFNDDLCAQVETVLGLPKGWLANPTKDIPDSVHPWVLDGSLPIPGAPPRKKAVQPKLLAYQRRGEAVPLPAAEVMAAAAVPVAQETPTPAGTVPAAAQRAAVKARTPRKAAAPVEPVAPAPKAQKRKTVTPAAVPAPAPEVQQQPVVQPVLALVTPPTPTPAPAPEAQPAMIAVPAWPAQAAQGPLMTALMQTLQDRAKAGTFTEKDALKLLNALYE